MHNINAYILIGCIFLSIRAFAQFPEDPFQAVYPAHLFSVKQLLEKGIQKVVIGYDVNKKGVGDVSGVPWFGENQLSYQQQKHLLTEQHLVSSTFYKENGDKDYQLEYTYESGKIVAIDHYNFDRLQEQEHLYSYRYSYKGVVPTQMVKLYMRDPEFRLMQDYSFNKDQLLVRRKVSFHGRAKRLETVLGFNTKYMLELTALGSDSKTIRYYRDMHDLVKTEHTLYEDQHPIGKKIYNEQGLLATISYGYEGSYLVGEVHTYYGDKNKVESEKRIYYKYNYQTGLVETIITEEKDKQTVYTFQYAKDY